MPMYNLHYEFIIALCECISFSHICKIVETSTVLSVNWNSHQRASMEVSRMGLWGWFWGFVFFLACVSVYVCGSPWTVEFPLLDLQNNSPSAPPSNLLGNILERIVQWLLEQSTVCVSGRQASLLDAFEAEPIRVATIVCFKSGFVEGRGIRCFCTKLLGQNLNLLWPLP